MYKAVQSKPIYGVQATKITHNQGDAFIGVTFNRSPTPAQYTHVISTIPLSTLRLVEFSGNACLDYAQRTAFRALEYIPSVKIALKFTYRWWSRLLQPIRGGRSGTDLNLRSIVYPSYGGDGDSGVLLVSYTLGQDSLRLGALSRNERIPTKYRDMILQELATIHAVPFEEIARLCESDWIWNWSAYEYSNGNFSTSPSHPVTQHGPSMLGAFAHFGPGQFEGLYPHVTRPAAAGRLHFVGEACSVLHGYGSFLFLLIPNLIRTHRWINGALESAMRGVLQMLDTMGQFGEITWTEAQRNAFIKEWGLPSEVEIEILQEQIRIGTALTSGEVPQPKSAPPQAIIEEKQHPL
jgi:monoamine oxidase